MIRSKRRDFVVIWVEDDAVKCSPILFVLPEEWLSGPLCDYDVKGSGLTFASAEREALSLVEGIWGAMCLKPGILAGLSCMDDLWGVVSAVHALVDEGYVDGEKAIQILREV